MGQQSSGKSTIAKIISFCTWVEKDVAISQSLDEYNVNGNFHKKLEDFHCLNGYFKENTEICYESDIIKLQFKNNKCFIEWVDKYAYKRSKTEYIPSERNLTVLPFIQKVDMPNNNSRNFLFDWLTIRTQYNKRNRVKILDLLVEYYFDEKTGGNHIISTDKNNKYDILLENASSGLQSLTPMIIALKYLTEWIYENEEETSFEKQQKVSKTSDSLYKEFVLKPFELYENKDPKTLSFVKKWENIVSCLTKTHNTQFIIEEPEQNLFPSTQRDLVYHLLFSLNLERGDRATITTHSPYILYALNNCMMGYLVETQLQGEEKDEYLKNDILSKQSWINPKYVSIWEIEDGTLRNIQDKNNMISENYFGKIMAELADEILSNVILL